ncbi:ribosomal RNA small subunit methyltransferase G [Lachnospiraceae bacterium]|uniref:16S rRNA (guanine(527)-N(7))-methyltransferase RsmG n=1 Tax=Extibacter sp. GGCC_0201 TaxID=2731209 RepID=UPI000829D47F|nr:16S rRNA (guanine(527)-N(7))-methyltransferase RsmG [Extibacter sp. GGCC_0201]MBO1720647.1 16S rRNA (guanine(527)-N(7))-methyltransferase RsmG [Extibacter sp. GGCC_0201]RGU90145.1 16S rRNA (guanine(527)-N(7))-methyltransferase RsmG [Clostridium sp. AF15-17LB]BDF35933.1 ribosomal RNA small subunit methyltransferase G [Lachnospiraceae bacterium]BDF39932.1 ribosomal RNA small subunit methyltransferase G [Lachnospiraceae bacterium]
MNNILESKLQELNITLDENQSEQFHIFYNLLTEWNKVMNLTGITEYEEVVEKHFLDSLAIVKAVDLQKVQNIIDIGTGAGFPGIPLKIAYPQLDVTLLDSLNKRVRFLDTVIENTGLNGIKAMHGRAEDYAKQTEYRENYDLCVSRAVANLATLSEYCIPYIRTGGIFVPYKSEDVENEVEHSKKAISLLGGNIKDIVKFQLPGTDIGRSFIIIEKTNITPKKYPRKAGLPTKEPLT